jgi:hypothetical protein
MILRVPSSVSTWWAILRHRHASHSAPSVLVERLPAKTGGVSRKTSRGFESRRSRKISRLYECLHSPGLTATQRFPSLLS